jgi:hypothetical protein
MSAFNLRSKMLTRTKTTKKQKFSIYSTSISSEPDLRGEPVALGDQNFNIDEALKRFGAQRHKKTTPAGYPESPIKAPEIPGPRFTNQKLLCRNHRYRRCLRHNGTSLVRVHLNHLTRLW